MDYIVLLVVFFVLIYYYIRRKYSYWSERGVLHQKPAFPFGNINGMGSKFTEGEVIQRIYEEFKGKDVLAGVYYFISPAVVPLDLDLLKNIFIKDFQYFEDRGIYFNKKDDPMSTHLFSIEGSYWRSLRAKLSPTFTSGKMKTMFPTFLMVSDQLKDYLSPLADKKSEIEVKEILSQFTTDIIGNVAFGVECNSLSHPENEFRKTARKILEFSLFRLLKVFFTTMNPNLARKLKMTITPPEAANFFMKLVKETVEFREKNNVQRNDFISLLLQIRNSEDGQMTLEELAAQVFLFFLAGFDTSSGTMAFALYELALNPDIQERVRQEVRQVLAKNNNVFNYEAALNLTYLDQVISETLRKYPVMENIIRKVKIDYKVPNTKHIIEKDTILKIPAFAIQRDPEIYPNPDIFDPERFTAENIAARHPMAWLPFGEGPRNCIGMRFGKMQVRIGIATIVNNFSLSPTEKTPIPMVFKPNGAALTPLGGMHLRIDKAL